MRILLVAPLQDDLPDVRVEVGTIASQHRCKVLQGSEANDATIARVLDDNRFDVIWWATHGSADGLMLTDGQLPTDGVAQYVRNSGAGLCVINTCSSLDIAHMVIDETGADAICTISEVPDKSAMRTGLLLSSALQHTNRFHDAYMQAKPGGGRFYRYVKNPSSPNMYSQDRDSSTTAWRELFSKRVAAIEETVKSLEAIVSGNDRLGLRGLRSDVRVIRDEGKETHASMQTVKSVVEEMKETLRRIEEKDAAELERKNEERRDQIPEFITRHAYWILIVFFLLISASIFVQVFVK